LLLALAAARASAQQGGKVYRVGFLGIADALTWAGEVGALRRGLRELGYEEGKNLVLEYRWAEGDFDRLPKLASELVKLNPDLIVTHGTPGSRAAKQATATIPVVMAAAGDPVRSGLVLSLARPGGNLTGNSILESDLALKRLELVKEIVPNASHVALLNVPGTQTGPAAESGARNLETAGRSLGIRVTRVDIKESRDLERAFAAMAKEKTDALIVRLDSLLAVHYAEIARLAIQYRLPTVGGDRSFVESGGLSAYGADIDEVYRHAAVYVDKILRGAKPADLPIEQPTKYILAINVKTAGALGLKIPQSVLVRAEVQ
jgi:ABC-type uncharacterized transport system substrate-binding protein